MYIQNKININIQTFTNLSFTIHQEYPLLSLTDAYTNDHKIQTSPGTGEISPKSKRNPFKQHLNCE